MIGASEHRPARFQDLVVRRYEKALSSSHDSRETRSLLTLLLAAGSGPVLPISVLKEALRNEGLELPMGRIRDILVLLGTIVARGNPGQSDERVGISHAMFITALTDAVSETDVLKAHGYIVASAANASLTSSADAQSYFEKSLPRHLLSAGEALQAFEFLEGLQTGTAADRNLRWIGWLPAFEALLGAGHELTARVRRNAMPVVDLNDEALAGRGTADRDSIRPGESSLPDDAGALDPPALDALSFGGTNELDVAINRLREFIHSRAAVADDFDPEIVSARSRLANLLAEIGDIPAAIVEIERVVDARTESLGSSHPDTLVARNALASFLEQMGDVRTALTEYAKVFEYRSRELGVFDVGTLSSLVNLAKIRGKVGDFAGAQRDLEQVISARVEILGIDHPETMAARAALAHWRGEAGDAIQAQEDLKVLLGDRLRVLGADHPDTLVTRGALAHWRGRAGNTIQAVYDLEVLLGERLRVLGPDHPDTLATRGALAYWRGQAGNAEEAVDDLENVLSDTVRVLGPDHPDTLATRADLAYWRGQAGDANQAMDDLTTLLSDRLRVLGPDHPDSLATRVALRDLRNRTTPTAPIRAAFDDFPMSPSGLRRICAKSGLALVAANGQIVGRVAKTAFGPLTVPPRAPSQDIRTWGKYDIANVRTIYGASPVVAAYAEALSNFRPPANDILLKDLFDDYEGDDTLSGAITAEWDNRGLLPPGSLPATWRHERSLFRLRLPTSGWFVDVGHIATMAALSELNGGEWGYPRGGRPLLNDLLSDDREVTTRIAAWLSQQVLDDGSVPRGIMFQSRFNRDWQCWAVWIAEATGGADVDILTLDRSAIPAFDVDADLRFVSSLLGVRGY